MRKIHTFRGEAHFSAWLYRVVMNTVFMQLRRKHLPQISLDEVLGAGEGAAWHGPAMHVARPAWRDSNARIDLDRAIGQLSTGLKVALLLHDVEDYRHREIAELRGWTVGTSKSQLHKARRRLRELLGDARRDSGYVSFGGTS
jgi:RNA polymerase sigma-70 factor (ECF subfamily)